SRRRRRSPGVSLGREPPLPPECPLHAVERDVLETLHSSAGALLEVVAHTALAEHADEMRFIRVPQDPGGLPVNVRSEEGELDLRLPDTLNLRREPVRGERYDAIPVLMRLAHMMILSKASRNFDARHASTINCLA